ncbi:hypothetical protein Bca4012_009860 [Brassica carinata]|uniref:F-box domain-containing protein n=1 Tax=Brassica carinata TaxID=52824 RepID=A0A8X7S6Z3_BRACI|nr:hypothetical protein Bca52824_035086 [Brassica carinata]
MKRERELTNKIDRVKTSDAIIETTSTSSLTIAKQKKQNNIPEDRTTNSDLFPTDLLMEILKKFPVKTLARLMCVSKLWASTIRRQEFNNLWSSNRQCSSSSLIFAFKRDKGYGQEFFFFSSPQAQKPHGIFYYGACFATGTSSVISKDRGVMSFDVRSEKFHFTSMTRYYGKLSLMYTWWTLKELQDMSYEELPLWDKDWKRRTVSIFPGQVENLMFL